jgi:ATP-binding cassette, subfamily C, bacterial
VTAEPVWEPKSARASFAFLTQRLRRIGLGAVGGLASLSVLAALAEGSGLVLLVSLLDRLGLATGAATAAPQPTVFSLEVVLALYLPLAVAGAVVVYVRTMLTTRFRMRVVDQLRLELHTALMQLRWSSFQRLRAADVAQTMMMQTVRSGVAFDYAVSVWSTLASLGAVLAVSFTLSWRMTLLALVFALPVAAIYRMLLRRHFALAAAGDGAARALMALVSDDLAGMRTIRAMGLSKARVAGLAAAANVVRARQFALIRDTARGKIMVQLAGALVAIGGLTIAVRGFDVQVADALVLVLAFGRLLMTGMGCAEGLRNLHGSLPALGTVAAMLAWCAEHAEVSRAPLPVPQGPIELHGVRVVHRDPERPALVGVDLAIPEGRMTAIIGPSGAGKSTLVDVIVGLLSPSEGSVTVGGEPLQEGVLAGWRNCVGYVPQDAFLFHDTIRANLLAARPDADEAALWAVLEQAAAGFVRVLPKGLDTLVGDRGLRLSGGERQRLALARALLRRPRLLVLDEATSALDAETERVVLAHLHATAASMTVVVVAHRLGTVASADHVVVVQAGAVVAAGSWAMVRATAPEATS